MFWRFATLVSLSAMPLCALAEPYNISREQALADYQINREEMSVAEAVMDILAGEISMQNCQNGYLLVKAGNYEFTEEVFGACAEAGYPSAMTWLSYSFRNGIGVPKDYEKMAYWDKRAAEAGDHAGMFNYGIDLMKGHGVEPNMEEGKRWIMMAANEGYDDAIDLLADDFRLPDHF